MADDVATRQDQDERADLHDAFYGALLDKVKQDRYPSLDMLDMLEQLMWGHERQATVEALLDKIKSERYPSPAMLRRLARLAG
jgi:hypothetical protein